MNELTPEQALNNINAAIRQLQVNADTHDLLKNCVGVLANLISGTKANKVAKPDFKKKEEEDI